MTLVDSSAWIEYYRREGERETAKMVGDAIRDDEAAVNGLILAEVAGFAKNAHERRLIEEDFLSCLHFQLPYELFSKASAISFELRSRGTAVPASDCVIAASAIDTDSTLVHRDRHFLEIAKAFPLRQRSALP